jgi:hypothetical protein
LFIFFPLNRKFMQTPFRKHPRWAHVSGFAYFSRFFLWQQPTIRPTVYLSIWIHEHPTYMPQMICIKILHIRMQTWKTLKSLWNSFSLNSSSGIQILWASSRRWKECIEYLAKLKYRGMSSRKFSSRAGNCEHVLMLN